MLKESDKQNLKVLIEKYGAECVSNILLEYSYGGHTFDHHMHSAGQKSEYRGLKGAAVVIPSFLLCSLISPPAAMILLLGAVTNRVCAKWHEQKDTILGALNPLSWAEYLATGNYRNKKGENDWFKKSGSSDKANADDAEVIRRAANNPNENPELGAVIQDTTKQSVGDMSLSDIEQLAFKYWFITFDNGEVFKVMAFNEESAAMYGAALVRYPLMLKRFTFQLRSYEQYHSLMKEEYNVYKSVYSDGQVLYTIGKNEQEAKATAKEMVSSYGKAYDEAFKKMNVNVSKFAVPNIVRMERQDDLELHFPKKVEKISDHAYVPGEERHETRNDFYWENTDRGKFWQYTILLGGNKEIFRMNFPSYRDNEQETKKLAREIIIKVKEAYRYVLSDAKDTPDRWYRVSFPDKDAYLIHAESPEKAKRFALGLYGLKVSACGNVFKGDNKEALTKGAQANGYGVSVKEVKKEKDPIIPDNIADVTVKVPKHLTEEERERRGREDKREYIINAKLGEIS